MKIICTAAGISLLLGTAALAGISQTPTGPGAESTAGSADSARATLLNQTFFNHADDSDSENFPGDFTRDPGSLVGGRHDSLAYQRMIDLTHTAPSAFAAAKWIDVPHPSAFARHESLPGMNTFPLNAAGHGGATFINTQTVPRYDGGAAAVVSLPSAAPVGFLTLLSLGLFAAVRRVVRRIA